MLSHHCLWILLKWLIYTSALWARAKMVNDGEESKRFRQLTLDCVSEESSPDEYGSMRVHRPVWCSSSKYSCLSFWCMLSHNWFVAWKRKPGMIHHNISLYHRTEYFPAKTGEEDWRCTAGYQETFGWEEKEDWIFSTSFSSSTCFSKVDSGQRMA